MFVIFTFAPSPVRSRQIRTRRGRTERRAHHVLVRHPQPPNRHEPRDLHLAKQTTRRCSQFASPPHNGDAAGCQVVRSLRTKPVCAPKTERRDSCDCGTVRGGRGWVVDGPEYARLPFWFPFCSSRFAQIAFVFISIPHPVTYSSFLAHTNTILSPSNTHTPLDKLDSYLE